MSIRIYDNDGETFDRYTVIIDNNVFTMSHNAQSPQGFNQYVGTIGKDLILDHVIDNKPLILFSELPAEVQGAIKVRNGQ